MRTNAPYSTWFNGGDRTTTGFHNQIHVPQDVHAAESLRQMGDLKTRHYATATGAWTLAAPKRRASNQEAAMEITAITAA